VVSVDDHPHAALHDLTTVRQEVGEQGAAAARITLDLMSGHSPERAQVTLPTELVVRGSTGPPP
jgi:DNA-binding LacI/PurR family transcriptional regulator